MEYEYEDDGKWILDDGEIKFFKFQRNRFSEICEILKTKRQAIQNLYIQQNLLCKRSEKLKGEIKALENEQLEIEKYLTSKFKKSIVVQSKIKILLEKLKTMKTEQEQINYLLNNKKDYYLFISIREIN